LGPAQNLADCGRFPAASGLDDEPDAGVRFGEGLRNFDGSVGATARDDPNTGPFRATRQVLLEKRANRSLNPSLIVVGNDTTRDEAGARSGGWTVGSFSYP